MNSTEQNVSDTLPLAAAAARLGIRPDALRMRINRGKIKGFKRDGRLFVVLGSMPDQAQRTANTKTEQSAFGQPVHRADARIRGAASETGEPSMPLVIEFQKVELSRLLRDNTRLNNRLDQMMEELGHLREMQQREQVLRQQEQALRQRAQTLIERLTAASLAGPTPPSVRSAVPPAAAPPKTEPISTPSRPVAAAPKHTPASPDAGLSNPTARPAGAAPMEAPEETTTEAGTSDEPPDSSRQESSYAYDAGAPPPKPPPEPPPTGPQAGSPTGPERESVDAWISESGVGESSEEVRRNSAELADMLKDIGASLRSMDTPAADTRTESPSAPGTRRPPGHVARPPRDEEAGILEILGRMGPSSEERRTAARLMKRLLKGHTTRRRGEPGDDAD